MRRCFDRLVSSFSIIIIIVIIIVIIVVVIILIITAPSSPSVVFNTNHFVNPLRYPTSFKKLPYSLWSVAKAFLNHARQPKVSFSLPRTQARSSGFVRDSRATGAILVPREVSWERRRDVFLAHPSQRPLRERYAFSWSIA